MIRTWKAKCWYGVVKLSDTVNIRYRVVSAVGLCIWYGVVTYWQWFLHMALCPGTSSVRGCHSVRAWALRLGDCGTIQPTENPWPPSTSESVVKGEVKCTMTTVTLHWWEIIDLLLPTFLSAAEHCSGSVSSHRQGKAWHTSRPAHDKIHSFVMSYAWEITTAIYNDRMFKRYKTYFCRQGHISLQGNQTLPQWIGGSENPNRIICT